MLIGLNGVFTRELGATNNSIEPFGRADDAIHIGVLNNMPDGALESTERQFKTLLSSAANGIMVCLSFYALPDVPRSVAGRLHVSRFYADIEDLWTSRLDGLIVTGAEPWASNLSDEPYWRSLTKVLEWADCNTHSVVLSCLAAHAGVLYFDGIGRRRLWAKTFGIFECERVSDHLLTADIPRRLRFPHSRWNDLAEDGLVDHGYRILVRTKDGSVDVFVKQRNSLFVLFQSHPEYEANTLLLEYRRDIGRFLRGESTMYPAMPVSYFNQDASDLVCKLQGKALINPSSDLLVNFPMTSLEKGILKTWHSAATCIYGNWLAYLSAQKEKGLKQALNPIARAAEAGSNGALPTNS